MIRGVAIEAARPLPGVRYDRRVRRGVRTRSWLALVTTLVVGVMGCWSATAMAAKQSKPKNRDVVTDTVYDGEFADSQNAWSAVQVQFAVTSADEVNYDSTAVAFCGPPGQFTFPKAKIKNDAFSAIFAVSPHNGGEPFRVTIDGQFESGGKAKGTGVLVTDTILGQPCRETDHWTAKALPKGTKLCPGVGPETVVEASVTNMTCEQAAVAYRAGVRHTKQAGPSAPFEIPGYDCRRPGDDPVPALECTRGDETLRLP